MRMPRALQPQDTALSVLQKFVSGKIFLHTFTVIEGHTWKQIASLLQNKNEITLTLTGDAAEVAAQLGVDHPHPEGWVLPETYAFARGTTDRELLRRGVVAMRNVLEQAWAQRSPNVPLSNPYEALILASIVEKETGQAGERARIAGVFTRRMRLGMPLQTDPTVIYGLGEAYAGNLTRKHLQQDNPHNTYTRKGLPPTPIAMPSRASIMAAVQPQESSALYFVAKGDGSHQFSATLDEHNAAVRQYQLQKKAKVHR
jgi:UPF0755 protein